MSDRNVAVGGDFNRIFDHRDYLAMVSIPDEATCVLRAHLILEEVLNLWCNKLTNTDDLYEGLFFSFKSKLVISKNLGLDVSIVRILDKINNLRNRFSHRRGHQMEKSGIDSIKALVDDLDCPANIQRCDSFHLFIGGQDQSGKEVEVTHTYQKGENRIKFLIVFVILMLKLSWWLQAEFSKRGIDYVIIVHQQG